VVIISMINWLGLLAERSFE
jgi:hypothetical protein